MCRTPTRSLKVFAATLGALGVLGVLIALGAVGKAGMSRSVHGQQPEAPEDDGHRPAFLSNVAHVAAGPYVDGVAVGDRALLARGEGIDVHAADGNLQARIELPGVPVALGADDGLVVALDERNQLWPIDMRRPSEPKVGRPFDIPALRNAEASLLGFGYLDPVVAVSNGFVYLVHQPSSLLREIIVLQTDIEQGGGIVALGLTGVGTPVLSLTARDDWLLGRAVWGTGEGNYPRPVRDGGAERPPDRAQVFLSYLRRPQVPLPGFVNDYAVTSPGWLRTIGGRMVDVDFLGNELLLLTHDAASDGSALYQLALSPGAIDPRQATLVRSWRGGSLMLEAEASSAWVLGREADGRQRLRLLSLTDGALRGTPMPTGDSAVQPTPTSAGPQIPTEGAPSRPTLAPLPPPPPPRATPLPRMPRPRPGAPWVPRERAHVAAGDVLLIGRDDGQLAVHDRNDGRLRNAMRHAGALVSVAADDGQAVATVDEGSAGVALVTFDLASDAPRLVGRVSLSRRPISSWPRRRATLPVDVSGPLAAALVNEPQEGHAVSLLLIDVTRPALPRIVGRVPLPETEVGEVDVRLDGGWAYIAAPKAVHVVDVRDVARPHVVDSLTVPWIGDTARVTLGPSSLVLTGPRAALLVRLLAPGRLHDWRVLVAREVVAAADAMRLHLLGPGGLQSMSWDALAEGATFDEPSAVPAGPAWQGAVAIDDYVLRVDDDLLVGLDLMPGEMPAERMRRSLNVEIGDMAVAGRDVLLVAGAGGLRRLRVSERPGAPRWRSLCAASRGHDMPLAADLVAPRWRLLDDGQLVAVGAQEDGGMATRVTLGAGSHALTVRADADFGIGPTSSALRIVVRPELPFEPSAVSLSWPEGSARRTDRPRGADGCIDPGVPAVGPIESSSWSGWTVGTPPEVPLSIEVPVRGEDDPFGHSPVVAVTVTLGAARVALSRVDPVGGGGASVGDLELFAGDLPGWSLDDVDPTTSEVAFVLDVEDARGHVTHVPGRVRRWRVMLPWVGAEGGR